MNNLAELSFNKSLKLDIRAFMGLTDAPRVPFKWQSEFEECDENLYQILTASTGAGKSRSIKLNALKWCARSPQHKVIVVVPQLSIGREYNKETIVDKTGVVWSWQNAINLCGASDTTAETRAFLDSNAMAVSNRVMVCSNATLVLALKEYKNPISNLKLISDEAHHISTAVDTAGDTRANGLGSVVLRLLQDPSNSIMMVTATLFRTDATHIVPDGYSFSRFEVPFWRVQDECRVFTKQIKFGYSLYKKNFYHGLKEVFSAKEKTIIFIHPREANEGLDRKFDSVKKTISSLGKIIGERDGCLIVRSGGKNLIVADLVTNHRQRKALEYIRTVSNDKTFKVDVIIAMRMFKEGVDYPPLQHCIIHDNRCDVDLVQMTGRVTRDNVTKPVAKMTLLVRNDINIRDEETVGQRLNDHLKLIVGAMSLINFFKPVHLRVKGLGGGASGGERFNVMSVIGDEVAQDDFRCDVIKKWEFSIHNDPLAKTSFDHRVETMNEVCKQYLSDDNQEYSEKIARHILLECALMKATRQNLIEAGDVDIEIIKKIDTSDFIESFASDLLDHKQMKNFADKMLAAMGEKRSMEEHKEKFIEAGGPTEWFDMYKQQSLNEQGYVHQYWLTIGMKMANWTIYCFGEKKTKEQHRLKFIEAGSSGNWFKIWKEQSLGNNGYRHDCGKSFGMTQEEWTIYCFGDKKTKSKEEHRLKFIEAGSSGNWVKIWKEQFLNEEGYLRKCWRLFRMTQEEWTIYCFGDKKTKSKEEHRLKFIEAGNARKWSKFRKEQNLSTKGYVSEPWELFDMTPSDWTIYCFGEKKTKEQHRLKFIEAGGWIKWNIMWKAQSLKRQGYINTFCKSFKMTKAEWTAYCFPKKKVA
jgi:hypothetical protein